MKHNIMVYIHAGVNVPSTNHLTNAAVVVNTNAAYGANDRREQATARNREDNIVSQMKYSYVMVYYYI